MIHLAKPEIWFVCGSQHLYGPGPLQEVAANGRQIASALVAAHEHVVVARIGRTVEAVTVNANAPSSAMLPISSAAERPTGVNEIWRNADLLLSAASGISICRSR